MNQIKYDNIKKLDLLCFLPSNNNESIKNKKYLRNFVTTKEVFEHGPDKKISFYLVRSKRRKTTELIIENENDIVLRAPFDKPLSEIENIIRKKMRWILEKQRRQKEKQREIVKPTFLAN
jgi:hypothetical protein